VENYPGFPDGISGPDLMDKFREQSVRCGTQIFTETITRVDVSTHPFKLYREFAPNDPITSDSIVVATGATARRMNLPGEDKYWQHGISACAVCDGAVPIFRQQELAVVGGGDSAAEEALFLTRFGSKIHVLVRRDKLRASKVMQDRLLRHEKVQVHWNKIPIEACGDGKLLKSVTIRDTKTGDISQLPVAGLFYGIGHDPNTKFLENQVTADETGYVLTGKDVGAHMNTMTSMDGVFACGDVTDKKYRQAVTAAGSGCQAALECIEWLETREAA
jgi:thioredoxin reductase (NADPH)